MSSAIVWFRRDLRVIDNPALAAACAAFEQVIPVYIDDAPYEGAAARAWLHRSLKEFEGQLVARGSKLIVQRGPSAETLLRIATETGAAAVFWNRLYEPATIERDKQVKADLQSASLSTESFNSALLVEPWELQTGSGGPYKVFSPFWRKAENQGVGRKLLAPPERIPQPNDWPASMTIADLRLKPDIAWDTGFWQDWTPGESGAQERLKRFVAGPISTYKAGRDIPSEDSVSGLSPHIHFGEISPVQLVEAARAARDQAPGNADWFVRELGWREFAHHVLYHFPKTPALALNSRYADFPWRDDYEPLLKAWQRGQTGIPLVDAGMRELWQTGYMHNRVRMVVASFLVKNIRAPWQAGADWFLDTLMDADLANNTLGWQWAAGCGADAAPYFRIFNPVLQGQKFDKEGLYVRRFVPELTDVPSRYIHNPWEMPANIASEVGVRIGASYPQPIVDLKTSRDEALAALKRLKDTE